MSEEIDVKLVRHNLEKKTTEQLLDILAYSQDDYNPLAISIIKAILIARNVSQLEIDEAENKYQNIILKTSPNLKTQKRIPKTNRFLIWLLYIVALGMASYLVKLVQKGMLNSAIQYSNTANKTPWSKEYSQTVYTALYKGYDNFFEDDKSKKNLANCVVEQLKIIYPNGLESLNKDSLKVVANKCGYECSKSLTLHYKKWPAQYDTVLKKQLLQSGFVKKIKNRYKEPFCNCYINKLEDLYPSGNFDKLSEQVKDTITIACAKEIKINQ